MSREKVVFGEALSPSRWKTNAAGGSVAAGQFDMEEVGRVGNIQDPRGTYLGIYQRHGDGSDSEGVFVRDELGTTDAHATQGFCEALVGAGPGRLTARPEPHASG